MSLLNEENSFYNVDLLNLLKDSSEAVLPYKRIRFRRNQQILAEGAETDYFYIIEDGVVSMSKNTCKEDSIINFWVNKNVSAAYTSGRGKITSKLHNDK